MSVWSYFKSLDVGRRVRSRLEGPTHLPKVAKGSGALSNPSKFALLSLSVADMSKLGKTGTTQGPTTVVHLHTFDMELLSWSNLPITVEFNEEKESLYLFLKR